MKMENQDWTSEKLAALDANDPLGIFRDRFLIPEGTIYMNGNSLGPLSTDARNRLHTVIDREWGQELIKGWNTAGWYDITRRVGDKLAKIVGADEGEIVLCDSTSVNLFKAVAAALHIQNSKDPKRTKIISEAGNFPTDLYILDGVKNFVRGDVQVNICDRSEIFNAINDETAVVVLTHVHYVTGEIFPMEELTEHAHKNGALIVWDLSHSVGAVETDLNLAQADFAVGCGYKHLNGGPGAPAFIYAAKRHHKEMMQPLSGWFSHKAPFGFTDEFEPTDGVSRMLCGTTPILSASALETAVDLFLEAEPQNLKEKRQTLSAIFCDLMMPLCSKHGLTFISPTKPSERGAHVSYQFDQGYELMQAMIDRGVFGDFRAPDFIRIGFSPLFQSYCDMQKAVDIIANILENRIYEQPKYQVKNAVT